MKLVGMAGTLKSWVEADVAVGLQLLLTKANPESFVVSLSVRRGPSS